jgi:hypothetical protein
MARQNYQDLLVHQFELRLVLKIPRLKQREVIVLDPKVSATAIATGLLPKPVGASNSMYL